MTFEEIVEKIKNVIGREAAVLHEPFFQGQEWSYVKDCLDTGWVSSVGKYVDLFEQKITEMTQAKYAIATVNGTAALQLCYQLAGIRADDEVLVSTLTFVATVNAMKYLGAVPHFVDCEKVSLGIDAQALESYLKDIAEIKNGHCFNRTTGRCIKALCVTHVFGHPADLDALKAVVDHYQLVLIEDAAEALGSYYNNRHVGHDGLVGALSFNGNKIVTSGGGGAILTDNEDIARLAKHLVTTAKKPHPWQYYHDQVGYNYRLPNINAALGCAQLDQLPLFLKRKRKLAQRYQTMFPKEGEIFSLWEPSYASSNYWLNTLVLNDDLADQRDACLDFCLANHLGVRPVWELCHTLPMYEHCPRMPLSVAMDFRNRLISVPSSTFLIEEKEVAYA